MKQEATGDSIQVVVAPQVGHALRFSALRRNKKRGRPAKCTNAPESATKKTVPPQDVSPLLRRHETNPNTESAQESEQGKLALMAIFAPSDQALPNTSIILQTPSINSGDLQQTASQTNSVLQTPDAGDLNLHSTENAVSEMRPPDVFAQFCSSFGASTQNFVGSFVLSNNTCAPQVVQHRHNQNQQSSHHFIPTPDPAPVVGPNNGAAVNDPFASLCSSSHTSQSSHRMPHSISIEIEDHRKEGNAYNRSSARFPSYPTSVSPAPRGSPFQDLNQRIGGGTGVSHFAMQEDFPSAVGDSSWMDQIFD
jgi:hypothetical protein